LSLRRHFHAAEHIAALLAGSLVPAQDYAESKIDDCKFFFG
jgi:hypothetical protein